ncbi:MAG: hypothetical protein J1G30_01995 [Spirochaetales bacterium]|nr:hypothetical protein [Spirochaetales bacterium]
MNIKNEINFIINTFKHLNNVEKANYDAFMNILYMIWKLSENTRRKIDEDSDLAYLLQYIEGLMEITVMIPENLYRITDFTPFNFLLTDCMLRLEKTNIEDC